LTADVEQYLAASYAHNTREAYRCDLQHFLEWGGRVPATPQLVAQYLAAHAGRLANSTLARRLVALNLAHRSRGLKSPTDHSLVRDTLRGIRRRHRAAQRQVAPLLKAQLLTIARRLRGLAGARDKALLLVGFAGAFRRSELVALEVTDLHFVPQGVVIGLRQSKTDQEGQGRTVAIPHARGPVCPVKALERWLKLSGIVAGKLFRAVDRHGNVGARGLSPHTVSRIVKARVAEIGLDPSRYAGHSLRAGLVTSAAQAGVSTWKIRQQTGHKSDTMVTRYIRDERLFVDNAAGSVL
jgi:integrase